MKETERIYYYPGNNSFRIIDPVVTRNFIGQETNEIWSGKQKFIVTTGWMAVGITYEEPKIEPEPEVEELPDPDPTECDNFDRPRVYSDDMDDVPF